MTLIPAAPRPPFAPSGRRLRQIAMAAATAICLTAPSWVVQAAPMNYAIAGAFATFNAGENIVDITGTFTIDPDTSTESNVSIFLNPREVGSPIIKGTYGQTDPISMPSSTSIVATLTEFLVPNTIVLQWQPLLPSNHPPPPTLIFIGSIYTVAHSITNPGDPIVLGGTLTGQARVVVGGPAGIPEPASLGLLSAALGFFLLGGRATRRGPDRSEEQR